jgi:hypothetical protein
MQNKMSENASTTTTTYSADFICTYKLMDNDDDRNMMYQIQILQAFGMQKFDQDEINEKVLHLYQKLIDCNQVKEIIEEGIKVNVHMQLTHEIMFVCLFSYQFFDLFHKCLIDYFTTGSILEESKRDMIHAIVSL